MQSLRLIDSLYACIKLDPFYRYHVKPSRVSLVLGGSELVPELLYSQRHAHLLTAITKNTYACLDERFVYEKMSKELLHDITVWLELEKKRQALMLLDQPEQKLLSKNRIRCLLYNNRVRRLGVILTADVCSLDSERTVWTDPSFPRQAVDYLFLISDGLSHQDRIAIWKSLFSLQRTYSLQEFSHLLDMYGCLVLEEPHYIWSSRLCWYNAEELPDFKLKTVL